MPTLTSELQDSKVVRIAGQGEDYAADVVQRVDGKNGLCVDANVTSDPQISTLSNKYRNVTVETTITLGTNYTQLYTYTGSGVLFGFIIKANAYDQIQYQVLIDGVVSVNITNTFIRALYGAPPASGITFNTLGESVTNSLDFRPPYPIKYTASILVQAKRLSTQARSISFQHYFLTKET